MDALARSQYNTVLVYAPGVHESIAISIPLCRRTAQVPQRVADWSFNTEPDHPFKHSDGRRVRTISLHNSAWRPDISLARCYAGRRNPGHTAVVLGPVVPCQVPQKGRRFSAAGTAVPRMRRIFLV